MGYFASVETDRLFVAVVSVCDFMTSTVNTHRYKHTAVKRSIFWEVCVQHEVIIIQITRLQVVQDVLKDTERQTWAIISCIMFTVFVCYVQVNRSNTLMPSTNFYAHSSFFFVLGSNSRLSHPLLQVLCEGCWQGRHRYSISNITDQ